MGDRACGLTHVQDARLGGQALRRVRPTWCESYYQNIGSLVCSYRPRVLSAHDCNRERPFFDNVLANFCLKDCLCRPLQEKTQWFLPCLKTSSLLPSGSCRDPLPRTLALHGSCRGTLTRTLLLNGSRRLPLRMALAVLEWLLPSPSTNGSCRLEWLLPSPSKNGSCRVLYIYIQRNRDRY